MLLERQAETFPHESNGLRPFDAVDGHFHEYDPAYLVGTGGVT